MAAERVESSVQKPTKLQLPNVPPWYYDFSTRHSAKVMRVRASALSNPPGFWIPPELQYLQHLTDGKYGGIPVVTNFSKLYPKDTEKSANILFRQNSAAQKRNLEADLRPRNEVALTWDGNLPYSSLQVKGITLDDLRIDTDYNMPSNVRYTGGGLLPLLTYARNASHLLQQLGIAAERILVVYQLLQLPIDGEKQTTPLAKDTMMMKFIEELGVPVDKLEKEFVQSRYTELTQYLQSSESNPAALVRLAGVPWRVQDISSIPEEVNLYRFAHVFAVTNTRLAAEESTIKPFTLEFNKHGQETESQRLHNQQEFARYVNHFAYFLGTQVGKLHKHGLTHRGLHTGNVDATGYLMDLDSVSGELLGTKGRTPEQKAADKDRDMREALTVVHRLQGNLLPGRNEYSDAKNFMQFIRGYYSAQQGNLSDGKIIQHYIDQSERYVEQSLFSTLTFHKNLLYEKTLPDLQQFANISPEEAETLYQQCKAKKVLPM
jgi:hypothetical protein